MIDTERLRLCVIKSLLIEDVARKKTKTSNTKNEDSWIQNIEVYSHEKQKRLINICQF